MTGSQRQFGTPTRQACLFLSEARYRRREVGGGRVARQPGQVRKEAALTSLVRVARPASRLGRFALKPAADLGPGADFCDSPRSTTPLNQPAGSPVTEETSGASAHGYRVLARKYR